MYNILLFTSNYFYGEKLIILQVIGIYYFGWKINYIFKIKYTKYNELNRITFFNFITIIG